MSRTFAYLRVSTHDQTIENQAQAIRARGYEIPPRRMIGETISGGVPAMERPGFVKLVDKLETGDRLVVLKLDRLGRDVIDVMCTVRQLSEAGIGVISLDLGDIDLTSSAGKASLGFMAVIAEMERDRIRERTADGLARARAQGVKFGRPMAGDVEAVRRERDAGLSQTKIADKLGLSLRTVKRYCATLNKADAGAEQ